MRIGLTRKQVVTTILAISLVISLAVYYFGQENVVCYHVCVNPVYGNGTREPVTLYVPIVLTKDGKIHEIMTSLKVYNASKVEIVDTKYGKALKIVTNNYTVIKGYYAYRTRVFSNWDPIKPSLTYEDYLGYHGYIYLDGKADYVNVSLAMCSESTFILEGGYCLFLDGTLKNGWNVYDLQERYTHFSYCKRVFK